MIFVGRVTDYKDEYRRFIANQRELAIGVGTQASRWEKTDRNV